MIDLHTHLLPNIDDGASDLEEALMLTKFLSDQNVSTAVCTPHFDPKKTSIDGFLSKRTKAMALMKDSSITLLSGSETMLHDYLFHYSDFTKLCIENTNYLLLELPFEKKWGSPLYDALDKLIFYYNVVPIIAHIERYPVIKKDEKYIEKLIEVGCIIQLNTSFILNKKNQKQAIRYIKQGYIDVLASDCHNMKKRLPIMAEAFDIITQVLDVEYSNKLIQNAQCIVNGIPLRANKVYVMEQNIW